MWPEVTRGGKDLCHLMFRVHQDGNSGHQLGGSNWNRGIEGTQVTSVTSMVCCLLSIQSRTHWMEVVLPTGGWDLPHQPKFQKKPPHTWLQDNLMEIFSQLGFCLPGWLKGMNVLDKWQTLGVGLKGRKMKWRPLVMSEKQRRSECLQWPYVEQFEYREIQTRPAMNHWIKSNSYTNITFQYINISKLGQGEGI